MTRSTRHRTVRARRRLADRVRARPRLEGLEDRCLLSPTITEFPVPGKAGPNQVAAGPDGNLWFTAGAIESSAIVTINPNTHAIAEFPIKIAKGAELRLSGITAGPDGNLWFTELTGNAIGEINPTTHTINQFPVGAGTEFITAGPDGNLWFTETSANKIGEINPATHAITVFPIPTASAEPEGITVGPDGNLWFAEPHADQIGMINPATHAITEFPVPTANAWPWRISAGPDGNLWFTAGGGNIGMINPATHAITVFPIPYTGAQAYGITAGPDGNLWFADGGTHAIGVVTLNPASSTHLVITQQPPASVTAGSGFGVTVQAVDSSGNLVSSFGGTVTVGLASNPGGTTLGGTLVVAASGGVATFSGLTITKVASGYTLFVYGSGPTSTTTNSFNVVSSGASIGLAVATPTGKPDSLLAPLVLDSPDLWDGLGLKKRSRPIG
jgi:virginiamycin B lyase